MSLEVSEAVFLMTWVKAQATGDEGDEAEAVSSVDITLYCTAHFEDGSGDPLAASMCLDATVADSDVTLSRFSTVGGGLPLGALLPAPADIAETLYSITLEEVINRDGDVSICASFDGQDVFANLLNGSSVVQFTGCGEGADSVEPDALELTELFSDLADVPVIGQTLIREVGWTESSYNASISIGDGVDITAAYLSGGKDSDQPSVVSLWVSTTRLSTGQLIPSADKYGVDGLSLTDVFLVHVGGSADVTTPLDTRPPELEGVCAQETFKPGLTACVAADLVEGSSLADFFADVGIEPGTLAVQGELSAETFTAIRSGAAGVQDELLGLLLSMVDIEIPLDPPDLFHCPDNTFGICLKPDSPTTFRITGSSQDDDDEQTRRAADALACAELDQGETEHNSLWGLSVSLEFEVTVDVTDTGNPTDWHASIAFEHVRTGRFISRK